MYNRGMNNFTFLDRDTIAATVPSALATTHDGLRSDRYRFVPTVEVIDSMEANGWGVVKIRAPKARMVRSQSFGLHQVEFQDRNAVAIQDPRSKVTGRGIFPRIHIINSHNGASRFEVLAGMYALVCSNGLMISTGSVGEFSVRHNAAFSVEEAHRVIAQFRSRMDAMHETVERWNAVQLTPEQANEFAIAAARIRWNKPEDIMPEPSQLLLLNRPEDAGNSLWATFNTVQENLMDGGFKRNRRQVRKMTHIRESNRINMELWDLAVQTAAQV